MLPKGRHYKTASAIARHVQAGAFDTPSVAAVLARARGRGTKDTERIALRLVQMFGSGRRPRLQEIAHFLVWTPEFSRAFKSTAKRSVLEPPRPEMQPCAGRPQQWQVPAITTVPALSEWLGVAPAELRSLTTQWRNISEGRTRHYHFQWIARRGGIPRLIEAPKMRLKAVQRRILTGILDHIPPHEAAHGFRTGRNIVTFTAPHAAHSCVLRMDVQDFFPSIRRPRVLRVFLNAGYPEEIAALLADLCTTATPAAIRTAMPCLSPDKAWSLRKKLQSRHLPQGAPTSPALANLCGFALDARLSGLARRFHAHYTRYADDLLFSGGDEFARCAGRCEMHAGAILLEFGLAAAHRKTKIMPQSVPQRAAGLVLNVRPGLPRRERDQLKAILTNCLRHGPSSQNRSAHPDFRAHLLGRLSHAAATHPASAAKLRTIFDAITWT